MVYLCLVRQHLHSPTYIITFAKYELKFIYYALPRELDGIHTHTLYAQSDSDELKETTTTGRRCLIYEIGYSKRIYLHGRHLYATSTNFCLSGHGSASCLLAVDWNLQWLFFWHVSTTFCNREYCTRAQYRDFSIHIRHEVKDNFNYTIIMNIFM